MLDQLSDLGITDARTWGSGGYGGVVAFSSRELNKRSGVVEANGGSHRMSNGALQARDRDQSHDRVLDPSTSA